MKKHILSIITLLFAAMTTAQAYELTKADGSEAHGTITFTVGGNEASTASEGDVVTVAVTANEGWVVNQVTGQWNAVITRAASIPVLSGITLSPVESQENTYTFTMERANAEIMVTYKKVISDDMVSLSEPEVIYTGEELTPTVTVKYKDGTADVTLTEGTDYTVAYSDNVYTGTAKVTVTGTGDCTGTVNTTFIIRADKTALNNAISETEAYHSSIAKAHPEIAGPLQAAINTAKSVQENNDAMQADVDNAVKALNDAKAAAAEAVLAKTKGKLSEDIAEDEAYYKNIRHSNPKPASALREAIDEAQAVLSKPGVTQKEVEDAITALTIAKTTAEEKVLEETRAMVEKTITEATSVSSSIAVYSPEIADKLKEASAKAQAVLSKPDATQTEVETALHELTYAVYVAKKEAEATGISNVKTAADTKDAAVYDLQGRRVKQPTKGLFIVNGKKVLVGDKH